MADDDVPLGSWPRLYAAVLVVALVAIALAALFSRWPF
jgi:anti-sigma-K factor RskA